MLAWVLVQLLMYTMSLTSSSSLLEVTNRLYMATTDTTSATHSAATSKMLFFTMEQEDLKRNCRFRVFTNQESNQLDNKNEYLVWLIYLAAAVTFTDWYWSSIVLLLVSLPMFSFFGVRSVEAGMIELKTVRPLFYRLLPTYKATQDELPRQRAELQKKVRVFVKKYSSHLGKLAEPKKLDGSEFMHQRSVQRAERSKVQLTSPAPPDREKHSTEAKNYGT
ncbi:hypothetical protein PsorP6_000009 [Peronosclerospora sorghi]|uniref:Uncharacterized protein n=1 Tax=Peronosclerospora sorghi TaxID=230839 RepID=A0ACC0WS98_9STRA|nr:hypothetical protein PsorP6_000009 [Peronosclerospora sorghi]